MEKKTLLIGISMARSVALLFVIIFITAVVIEVNPVSKASAIENTWATKAPLPPSMDKAVGAATVNGKIYAMSLSFNYEYDPTTDKWTEKASMPTPRTNFAITVYQNKIYVIGAYEYSCANEVYDPATDTWETKAQMPTNRTLLSASAVGGKIHLFSREGYDVYDIATDSWTAGREMPYEILYPKSAVIDDKIYIIGWNLTAIYDPKSDTWSLGATAPEIASNPGVCATTGVMAPKRIYVFGGSVGAFDEKNVTQVYDPEKDTWTLGAPMPTARVGLDAVVVDDVIFAIGGGYGWGFTSNANELYTPFGYGTPDPSYKPPNAGTPPSPSEPFPVLPVAVAFVTVVALIGAGLFVYFKKRKR